MTQAGLEFAVLQPGIAGEPLSLCPAEAVSVFLVGAGHQEKLFRMWQAEASSSRGLGLTVTSRRIPCPGNSPLRCSGSHTSP